MRHDLTPSMAEAPSVQIEPMKSHMRLFVSEKSCIFCIIQEAFVVCCGSHERKFSFLIRNGQKQKIFHDFSSCKDTFAGLDLICFIVCWQIHWAIKPIRRWIVSFKKNRLNHPFCFISTNMFNHRKLGMTVFWWMIGKWWRYSVDTSCQYLRIKVF